MIFDSHLHINLFLQAKKIPTAFHAIIPSTISDKWEEIEQICRLHSGCLPAYGLHPWFEHTYEDIERLHHFAGRGVAVGECGLDKRLSKVPFNVQLDFLDAQLEIAQSLKLPVILHCVKANNELLNVLSKYPSLSGVIHGFNGSAVEAKRFLEYGYFIGISSLASLESSAKLHAVLRSVPQDRLLIETDAPNKHFRCFDNYIKQRQFMVEGIAKNLMIDEVLLINQSNKNIRTLFKLPN